MSANELRNACPQQGIGCICQSLWHAYYTCPFHFAFSLPTQVGHAINNALANAVLEIANKALIA